MKPTMAIPILALILAGCGITETAKPTAAEQEKAAREVLQRFQASCQDGNIDMNCLTTRASNGFFAFWRDLIEAEGIQAMPDQGFHELTKDAAVQAGGVEGDTVRLIVPVKLKKSSKIVITFMGYGRGCRIEKFEAAK